MENFIINNPTCLHFGKGVIGDLSKVLAKYGNRVLLVYGKNSIKDNGIYQKIINQMNIAKANVFEYSGIKSNPVISDVDAAAAVGRKNQVDVIVAVGGGSVIDSAKIIGLAIPLQNNAWDIMENKVKPTRSIPLIAVLTLAATGSEMNPFAVVQNDQTKQKPGYFSPFNFPKHSFLDPEYTFSVPADYTAYGIVDLVAHALESFFGKGETSLTDRFVSSIIKEAVEYGPLLLKHLNKYEYREKIMFAATCALNGMTSYGKKNGDWGVHGLGHTLSVLYDVPHGASLSVAYPAWMKYFKNQIGEKLSFLGKEIFNTPDPAATIQAFEMFFKQLGAPTRLGDLGLTGRHKIEIINNMLANKVSGDNFIMEKVDFENIFDLMAN
ncbi:MAG TPA: iron-containing alcohol dehydrogenase [Bacteroidales bacterium]|nr:iron-containing alcohol dehydrogenase [Bacteroidales bacterium]HOH83099.1 iron-containing alcohol dehydrogenase [Bacteroidales bacterium]